MILYRLLISLATPVVALGLIWRILRGRESWSIVAERLGGRAPAGPALWLHGASNGELTSARPFIDRVLARWPGAQLVITTNTVTGRALVVGWDYDRVSVRLAPLDHRLILTRFLRRVRPAALIVIENELWPNRFAMCKARNIPVILVGARMSARAAGRWQKLAALTRPMARAISWASAQDDSSADALRSLGITDGRLGPVVNLKAGVELPPVDAAQLSDLQKVFMRDTTVLAASTHEGEELLVLQAFAAARPQIPSLRLILAPRHPRRATEIRSLLADMGLLFATRSLGETPGPDTPVYLTDTMGDMSLWYRLAGITFVGGSLVNKGGHTPFEPAQAGTAILHGPHLSNFATAYATLLRSGGARQVEDAASLGLAMIDLTDPETRNRMTEAAARALMSGPASLDPLLDAVAAKAQLDQYKEP